jgi:uncharacterized protein YciI
MKKLIFICSCLIVIGAAAQDTTKVKSKTYLGVLTLTDKYKDALNWTKNDEAIVGEHFVRLVKFKTDGVVVLAGRTELALNNPEMMGLVVFYAKDDNEALRFMMDDPAVKNKIMQAKVHPYGIAVIKCDN